MLDNYLRSAGGETTPEKQRIIALTAALELAKAALGASSANVHSTRVADSLNGVSQNIEALADAIQEAAKVK
ncbi:hypothetical protein [Pantoea ananatis]|uniref:hypothetical protein n=1 Tax=Pantoea ananas TaxID=553 RepID=UPI0005A4F1A3|nr:hypothetical protein [Pantoea ananatis]